MKALSYEYSAVLKTLWSTNLTTGLEPRIALGAYSFVTHNCFEKRETNYTK